MHNDLEWDELRLVLTIARDGGLSGAARTLRVNHATVFRRLNAVEARLGVRLFERFRTGYAPTPAGEAVVALAERIEEDVHDLGRRLAGEDMRPSGNVRITTTDALLPLLGACLPELRRRHPDIVPETVVSTAVLSLSRRDADIALRMTQEPPPELVGRKVYVADYAVYGLTDAPELDLASRPWVAPDDTLAHVPTARWMRANVPDAPVAGRSNTLVGMLEMVLAGLGVAMLPCFRGDTDPRLRRISGPAPLMSQDLWLLTHPDLRRVGRIRAVMEVVADVLVKRPLAPIRTAA